MMDSHVVESKKKSKKTTLLQVYMWAVSFMYPYKWVLSLLIICVLVETGVTIAIPKFIQYFTDTILISGDVEQFKIFIGILIGAVTVMILFVAWRNICERIVQEKACRDLQYSIYAHLRTLGFAYFEKHPIGESLSLMNSEVASLQDFYRRMFPWMINGLLFSVLAITLMMTLSVKLSIVMLLGFLFYYIFGPYLDKQGSLYAKKLSDDRIAFNQKTYESIASIQDIRANGAQKWDLALFMKYLRKFNKTMVKTYWFAYWRGTNRRLSYNIGALFIFIYGIHLVRTNGITTGEFIAFILLYFQTMHVLTSVVSAITEQRVLMHQAEKLYQFLKQTPAVQEVKNPIELANVQGNISLKHVSFAYSDESAILNHVNLHIQAGEKVAIVGESGGGKTTILKLLGRFYDPIKGEITLDGVPIHKLSFPALRENLGFVFQETYLFGTTVKENILFGKPHATEDEMIETAKAANAHTFIEGLPNGYDTLLGERGVKLSGGQKQRISIARMFIKNPPILLLDEATSALDNVSEKEVQSALERLMRGRTTITIAHRLSTIMDYDKIVLLDKGRIVESGTYETLVKQRQQFFELAMSSRKVGESI